MPVDAGPSMSWSTFLPTFGFLFLVVMARANATYWIGRGSAAGARRLRRAENPSRRWQRAAQFVNRWGPIAVVLCFLTVGIQTAVNATAGIARMPLRRYLPAVIFGSVLWATLYATVGLAAARAWLAAAARWPGTMAVVAVLAVLVVVVLIALVTRRRLRARRAPAAEDGEVARRARSDMRS